MRLRVDWKGRRIGNLGDGCRRSERDHDRRHGTHRTLVAASWNGLEAAGPRQDSTTGESANRTLRLYACASELDNTMCPHEKNIAYHQSPIKYVLSGVRSSSADRPNLQPHALELARPAPARRTRRAQRLVFERRAARGRAVAERVVQVEPVRAVAVTRVTTNNRRGSRKRY